MTSKEKIEMLEARVTELENELIEARKPRKQKSAAKYRVLEALQEGPKSTSELAQIIGTSKNTIGSYLTYLRKDDGIILHMNHLRQHYIAG